MKSHCRAFFDKAIMAIGFTAISLSCEEPEQMGAHYLSVILRDEGTTQRSMLLSNGMKVYPVSGFDAFHTSEPGSKFKVWFEAIDTVDQIIQAEVRRHVEAKGEVFSDHELSFGGTYSGHTQRYDLGLTSIDDADIALTVADEAVIVENPDTTSFPLSGTCAFLRNRGFGEIEFACPTVNHRLDLTGKFQYLRAVEFKSTDTTYIEHFVLWRKNEDGTFVTFNLTQDVTRNHR